MGAQETSPGGPDQVLQLLKDAARPVSGEALAGRLGLSRTAIWKRINRLKSRGYGIEGSPRRGYRLVSIPDLLLSDEILPGLHTRLLRGPVHHYPELGSTNDRTKELGAAGAPEGTVVVAEAQSRGRGRLGREWDSPPGVGLYVSLLLRPSLPPQDLPQITLTTAVAVVRAVRRVTGLTLGIKWPNDLLYEGKKVGGILTEMETEAERIRHLVVGLGLNVNNPAMPAELAASATSLALAGGGAYSRVQILRAWLEEFDELYRRFLEQGFPQILNEWRQFTVTLGHRVTVQQGPRLFTGLALEVAADGALMLQTENGEVRVTSGEITPGPAAGGPVEE